MSNVKGPDDAQNPDFEELVAQYQGSVLRMCFLYLCDYLQNQIISKNDGTSCNTAIFSMLF